MRNASIALRWPAGVLLTAWSYMWRTTPMWRTQCPGVWPDDGPPGVAAGVSVEGWQRPQDGVGPLFRRRYRALIHGSKLDAAMLMAQLQADPNRVAPGTLARFVKARGEPGHLDVGDEFVVRMPGPWDGPIRIVEVTSHAFRSITLEGHLEAGQIEWRAADRPGGLQFEIESWARGGDRFAAFLHDRLPMAKEVQLHMWTRVCERVAGHVGGRLDDGIEIETRRVQPPDTR